MSKCANAKYIFDLLLYKTCYSNSLLSKNMFNDKTMKM